MKLLHPPWIFHDILRETFNNHLVELSHSFDVVTATAFGIFSRFSGSQLYFIYVQFSIFFKFTIQISAKIEAIIFSLENDFKVIVAFG